MTININNIDSIIFDFGGVIINIDYTLTINAFSELAGFCVKDLYTQAKQVKLFDDFECGFIEEKDFREGLRNLLNLKCSDEEIDSAWNLMLLDIPKDRVGFLENIAKDKKIYLLSNTNSIHKKAFDKIFVESYGHKYSKLDDLFNKAYYSHLIGKRKPNTDAFQFVFEENNLNPETTLFIDDTLGHIKGAQKLKLQTHHLKPKQEVYEIPSLKTLMPNNL